MRRRLLVYELLLTALVLGCGGGSSSPTAPSGGGGNPGGDGGGGGGNDGGDPVVGAVTVTAGNNFFRSDQNGSVNLAVDTVAAGGTVTWRWVNTGVVPHNVQSVDSPSFTSSQVETGNGSTYQVTFTTPGSYRYNCAIHGNLMTGVVVVRAQ